MLHSVQIDPNKVAKYVRWSTDDQGDGTTLEVQLDGCKHYILSQGWSVNEDLVFVDDGYSGGDLNRPAMTRLREKIRKGEVDCVVVYKLDRLSRSVVDTVNLVLEEWEDVVYLKSAREPVDTTTPMGKQFFYMLVSFAEWERNVIKERTFGGKLARAKSGFNPGFRPPYGYRVGSEAGSFEIVEDEAAIVKQIFHDYANGLGYVAITKKLNDAKIPFRKGRQWNHSTIAEMLQNRLYIGKMVFGKKRINNKRNKKDGDPFWLKNDTPLVETEANIQPIIEQKTFDLVQRTRESKNVRFSSVSGRAISSPHLLTGLLKCSKCNTGLGFHDSERRGRFESYYRCRGSKTKGNAFCDAGYIPADSVNDAVIDDVKDIFLSDADGSSIANFLTKQQKDQVDRYINAIKQLKAELANLTKQAERLDYDYRNGSLSATRYDRLVGQIERDIESITSSLEQANKSLEAARVEQVSVQHIEEMVNILEQWDSLPVEKRKAVLRKWVKEIVIYKPKGSKKIDMEIVYRSKDLGR